MIQSISASARSAFIRILAFVGLGLALGSPQARAASQCLIQTNTCTPSYAASILYALSRGTFDANVWEASPLTRDRCLARAADFHWWCQDNQPVSAVYKEDGHVNGRAFYGNGCFIQTAACKNPGFAGMLNPLREGVFDTEIWFPSGLSEAACHRRAADFRSACMSNQTVTARYVRNSKVVSAHSPQQPIVGAIRWDDWTGAHPNGRAAVDSVGRATEYSLGPAEYHYRLPVFSSVTAPNQVTINGYSQQIVDDEITLAHDAGLSYWAFVLYDVNAPISQALNFYLTSSKKADINFSAIVETGNFSTPARTDAMVARLIGYMSDPSFQRVKNGRPLLYLLHNQGSATARNIQDFIFKLRHAIGAINQGRYYNGSPGVYGQPYIVMMNPDPAISKPLTIGVVGPNGADAISAYAISQTVNRAPYTSLTSLVENFWDRCQATGAKVVPLAMAGWDRRPRIFRPVPWEDFQKPGVGADNYYDSKSTTPAQLKAHLARALNWVSRDAADSKAVLLYAWNEHDEGGWIAPTLKEGFKECPTRTPNCMDTSKLSAIRTLLNP